MPADLDTPGKINRSMMKILLLPVVAAILLLASCRSTRSIQTAIGKKDSAVAAIPGGPGPEDTIAFIKETSNRLKVNSISFTTFSAKIDVDYSDAEGKKFDVNAHVRMYKDSVIWISVTAILGIEAFRAYITKDSVKLLNKQDKVYSARSVSFLQEVVALPLDLYSLQDLLVGNPVFLDSNIVSYSRTGNTISLLSIGSLFKHLLTMNEPDMSIQSSKLDDLDEMRNRTCYLTYGDYETKKGPNFSTRRNISVSEKKKLDIRLNFKQYDFNETLSFPFAIPKNYDRN
jgi:hypothetical protein